jgi:cellobiose dehydrogenase (acceptor)
MGQGVNVLSAALKQGGWTGLDVPNNSPAAKNRTYGSTTYMFSGGERRGPMATYLKTAADRDNFQLWMNTPARRALRTGGSITGVELDCTVDNGKFGTISVTPKTGRVIVSAGTFGSAKFLMRSKTLLPLTSEGESLTVFRWNWPARPVRSRQVVEGRPVDDRKRLLDQLACRL